MDAARLLVRADGGAKIGLGHAMRCLALAEAWRDAGAGPVTWAARALPDSLRARLGAEEVDVVDAGGDAASFRAVVEATRPVVCVVDGYHLGVADHDAGRATGALLVLLDDAREVPLACADVVLNQNAHATRVDYADVRAVKLLGSRYTMLRRELRVAAETAPSPSPLGGEGRRVLLTMGGADPHGATVPLAHALLADARTALRVLIGPAFADPERVRAELAGTRAEVLGPVDDVVPLYRAADLVVAAAGSTLWELAALGVPCLALVAAENQAGLAADLDASGAGRALGSVGEVAPAAVARAATALLDDAPARAAMSVAGRASIDAKGATRVVVALRERLALRR